MDEYDDDLEQGSEEVAEAPAATADVAELQKKLKKFEKDNYKLRGQIRRAELTAKFGSEIAELVPDALPYDDWEAHAERLAALRGPLVETKEEPSSEEAEAVPEDDQRLAAAVGGSSPTGASPHADLSNKDILELGKIDPARAMQAIKAKFPAQ